MSGVDVGKVGVGKVGVDVPLKFVILGLTVLEIFELLNFMMYERRQTEPITKGRIATLAFRLKLSLSSICPYLAGIRMAIWAAAQFERLILRSCRGGGRKRYQSKCLDPILLLDFSAHPRPILYRLAPTQQTDRQTERAIIILNKVITTMVIRPLDDPT